MKYGPLTLRVEYGSVSINKYSKRIVRHYLDTNKADSIDLGKEPTEISVRILAIGDAERVAIEQILHSSAERELDLYDFKYKRVVTDQNYTVEPQGYKQDRWTFAVVFIALDPIPYSLETGNYLY